MKNEAGFAIEFKDLSKSFGGVAANAGIDLQVKKGSIHAIIGENGAGKSTAMKMLFGIYRPDSGEIWVDGVKRDWKSPRDAIHAGIGMVHQHFMLAEPESALENVLLEGVTSTSFWRWLPPSLRPMNKSVALTKLKIFRSTIISRSIGLRRSKIFRSGCNSESRFSSCFIMKPGF